MNELRSKMDYRCRHSESTKLKFSSFHHCTSLQQQLSLPFNDFTITDVVLERRIDRRRTRVKCNLVPSHSTPLVFSFVIDRTETRAWRKFAERRHGHRSPRPCPDVGAFGAETSANLQRPSERKLSVDDSPPRIQSQI